MLSIKDNLKEATVLSFQQEAEDDLFSSISVYDFLEKIHTKVLPLKEMYADYKCAAMGVATKFRVLNERFSIHSDGNPIESIKTRIKTPESILKKMELNGWQMSLESVEEHIHDIAGVRVICSFVEDIYKMAEYLLVQDDITLVNKKDYITNPKPSGYRSMHLIVQVPIFTEAGKKMMKVEVQFRTIAMDFWASLEHKLRYKNEINEAEVAELSKELKACSDVSAELDMRMQNVRTRILSLRQAEGD